MTNKERQEELKTYDDGLSINLSIDQCLLDMGYVEFEATLKEVKNYNNYLYICGTELN